ncbi:MAG TPA: DUF1080 domain-containing protein [Pirellulales bacterium]|jgi:hypothetical protein|nr:DUF1080 domain-containing protein [Pirellulales bacterium]
MRTHTKVIFWLVFSLFAIAANNLTFLFADKPASDAAQEKPAAHAEAKKADANKEEWHSMFDGKSLGDWKPSKFATQGTVEVKDGRIVLGFGDGCSGITWSGKFPKTNYEIRLQAMRVDGSDFFCGLTFPVGDDPCSFICGGWGGAVVGLSSIDGEDASENGTTKVKAFDDNKWYTIRVRVTKHRISAWIDGDQMVDQGLVDHKISIRSEVEDSKPLGIASWKTTAAARQIEWRKLTEDEAKEEKLK